MLKAIITLANGPMAGARFDVTFVEVPAKRLMGQDIHPDLVGTYELTQIWEPVAPEHDHVELDYSLRQDDDYARLQVNRDRRRRVESS